MFSLYSSLISSVAKARQYSHEPQRIEKIASGVVFQGDHGRHVIRFVDSIWQCDCEEYRRSDMCRHIRTLDMIEAETGVSYVPDPDFWLTPILAEQPVLPG